MNQNKAPLIVIVGETASGKSDLAISLAKKFKGEIVCADALTVRRGVDIGSAKPSHRTRQGVKHHLVDVVEPCADFTAAVYKQLAVAAIADITGRGKLPILVGGTGLYIDAVLYDYGFLPAGDRATRHKLNNLSVERLGDIIREKGLDDSGLDVRNKRRLIRLLETGGARPSRKALRTDTLLLGTYIPRQELESRIQQRIGIMLQQGLKREVERLVEKYGWDCEGLKGIGYREWRGYFDGVQDLSETRARIFKATLGLAKRQRTWFKRNKSIHWINDMDAAADLVTTFLART